MPPTTARRWLTEAPFAHRGLHNGEAGIIENSPSAFGAAIAEGFGIELDVQLTADGRAVVFHDDTLDRLTTAKGAVAAHTLAQLERVGLEGSADHIPSLEAVLALIDGRVPVLVEIKGSRDSHHRLEQAVAQAILGYRGAVAIMSFAPTVVAWFHDCHPRIVRGLVASTRYRRELGWRLSRPDMHRRLTHDLDPAFVAYDIRSLPNAFTMGWRKSGRPLLTWTVRTPEQRLRARHFTDNIIFERQ